MNLVFEYSFAASLMALGWSLRGQFGHLKGALIPGAFAALLIILLSPKEDWRKTFGLSLILGAIGFSFGGYLGYGKTIETLLQAPTLLSQWTLLLEIFLIGAIWGGWGMTLLAFAFSEDPFDFMEVTLLSLIILVWVILLGMMKIEGLELLLFGTGFVVIYLFNCFFKKSKMISLFGLTGVLGFGGAFLFSVLLLFWGSQGIFGEGWRWWALRDQIIGALGGIALLWAGRKLIGLGPMPAHEHGTLFNQQAGFTVFLVLIPALNGLNAFAHLQKQGLMEGVLGGGIPYLFLILFLAFAVLIWMAGGDFFTEKSFDHLLYCSSAFFILFLSTAAILKGFLTPHGHHWEDAYTFFILLGTFSLICLRHKVYRFFSKERLPLK